MDFALTDEHEMIRRTAREFVDNEVVPHVGAWEEAGQIPRDVFDKMAELGFLGAKFPTEYGGSGLDQVGYVTLIEEIARGCSSLRTAVSVQSSLAGTTLHHWGSKAQKEEVLTSLCTGERIGCWALTEPQAGSDAANQQTTAKRDGDDWVLNGKKIWISNGDIADVAIIFARTGPDRHGGISVFVVPTDADGFSVGSVESNTKLGLRASGTAELIMEQCRIPEENLIGEEGQGWEIAMDVLNSGRISVAAGAVGIAQAAYEEAKRWSLDREAFDRPIAKFQLVKDMIARMAMGIEAGRLLVQKAAWQMERGAPKDEVTLAVSMAKLFTAEMCMDVTEDAVQVHGGYGYSGEVPVERYFRDAKICGIYEGTNQIHTIIIADQVLGLAKN